LHYSYSPGMYCVVSAQKTLCIPFIRSHGVTCSRAGPMMGSIKIKLRKNKKQKKQNRVSFLASIRCLVTSTNIWRQILEGSKAKALASIEKNNFFLFFNKPIVQEWLRKCKASWQLSDELILLCGHLSLSIRPARKVMTCGSGLTELCHLYIYHFRTDKRETPPTNLQSSDKLLPLRKLYCIYNVY
jgi:hypothetical protein